ncbi:hypothetical protein ACWY7G_004549 [Enterobacter hormaechei]|uniref:hypothetical protein n=1 Tax=Enterobacter cloacae complex TaxID=354276 RepID=UPI0006DA504E|nr:MULTISPECIES: hypothetical protein [Enterobacter cloacae complex]HAV1961816.1 hypothetical protein [Enterobacter hormaechei subsp. xiangfangensis]EJK8935818.1 hypothetical protein [Enterobacter hormaechei]EJK8939210.1 hypothetical protein [Enterobacter hormaechei]EKS6613024.1 hypothetical protein [Enterobacter hormaechei]EKU3255316.1 hypothetical protein [Enterobacter hormaechei]
MTNQHPAYMDGPAALRTLYAEAERRDSDADRLRAFSTPKTQPITTSLSGKVNTLAGHILAAAARGEIEDSTSGWRDLPNRPETPEQIRLEKITPSTYQMAMMGKEEARKRSSSPVLMAGMVFRNASDGAAWAGLHPSTFNQAVRQGKLIAGKYRAVRIEEHEISPGIIDMREMSKDRLARHGSAFMAAEAR